MCGLGFALYLSAELPDRYYLAKGDHFSIGDNRLIKLPVAAAPTRFRSTPLPGTPFR
jgi:hypothetical protein